MSDSWHETTAQKIEALSDFSHWVNRDTLTWTVSTEGKQDLEVTETDTFKMPAFDLPDGDFEINLEVTVADGKPGYVLSAKPLADEPQADHGTPLDMSFNGFSLNAFDRKFKDAS